MRKQERREAGGSGEVSLKASELFELGDLPQLDHRKNDKLKAL